MDLKATMAELRFVLPTGDKARDCKGDGTILRHLSGPDALGSLI
jgi:hypothetical protein